MDTVDEAELDRLREIAALELGADIDDPALQTLVERAALELELPIAAVSIILDSAQYLIAAHGLGDGWIDAASGTPGEWAFCRNAVDRRAPFIVEDATTHPLVRDNPLVGIDGIRCYLGVPLITRNQQAIGTLCVLGVAARSFSDGDLVRLRTLADDALALLEARRDN
jgi:GAF domain-containing protein